jgi:hypothetical protein
MNSTALRHLVERAAATHGERFPEWFPESFEWADLCRDAPAMADRLGRRERSEEADRRIESLAAAVFRAAYLAGLSVLAARAESEEDPETIVGRLARPLDEEEQEVFTRLAEGELAGVESALGDETEAPELSPDGVEGLRLVGVAWPPTAALVGEAVGTAAAAGGPEARVLGGIARVATILAAFRWLAADRANEGWPTVVPEGMGGGAADEASPS